jgi:hypothetical protein
MNPDKLRVAEAEGLHRFFKLQTTVSLSSMVCAFNFVTVNCFVLKICVAYLKICVVCLNLAAL